MEIKTPIYMDNHATTPLDPRVLEEMMPYFKEKFGNAASIDHIFGSIAYDAVQKARERIANSINAKPEEIIFTSGATESDNFAIFGIAEKYADKGNHIITCVTEHKAILDSCKKLESTGKKITYLPVDKYGKIDLKLLKDSITDKTILISIMSANNEIGTIAEIEKIGKIAKDNNIFFHTDAAQAVGHIPMDVQKMNIDLMSISAHKIYGPKGIGAIYIRKVNPMVRPAPIIYGGGHERSFRSGTLNVPAIVGFGKAVQIANKEMHVENERLKKWTNQIFDSLQKEIDGIELNGHPTDRLAHNLNIYIKGIESKALLHALREEVAISAGSACTTADVKPSYVIKALGYDDQRAHSSIRFGLGRFNSEKEVNHVLDIIVISIKKINQLNFN